MGITLLIAMYAAPTWAHNTKMNDPWIKARKAELKQVTCALNLIFKSAKRKNKIAYNYAIDALNSIKQHHYASIMFYYEGQKMERPLASRSLDSELRGQIDLYIKILGLESKVPTILRNALQQCRP